MKRNVTKGRLIQVLSNLVNKLEEVHVSPYYISVWTQYANHGFKYNGPTYHKEFDEAKMLVKELNNEL